jgi:hypothetical protein
MSIEAFVTAYTSSWHREVSTHLGFVGQRRVQAVEHELGSRSEGKMMESNAGLRTLTCPRLYSSVSIKIVEMIENGKEPARPEFWVLLDNSRAWSISKRVSRERNGYVAYKPFISVMECRTCSTLDSQKCVVVVARITAVE